MAASDDERAPWSRLAVLVLVVGGSASILGFGVTLGLESRSVEHEFDGLTETFRQSLTRHVSEQIWALESERAFWNASREVERVEFSVFTSSLLKQFSGIETIAWARRVPSDQRAQAEQDLQSEIQGPVALHGRNGTALDTKRDYYFPVWYLEPPANQRFEIGLELGADKELGEMFSDEAARDRVFARRVSPLNGDVASRSKVIAALAIYRPYTQDATPDERRTNLAGFVVEVFDIESAVDAALMSLPPNTVADVLLWVDDAQPGTRLAHQHSRQGNGAPGDEAYANAQQGVFAKTTLTIGPTPWSVVCVADPRFVAARRGALPWVLLISGLAFSVLIASYIRAVDLRTRSLTKSNAGLYTEIAERHAIDKELRETQRALATLVANLPGLAYRCRNDMDWSMEFISDGSIPLTGYPPSDFLRNKVSFGNDVIQPADRKRVWDEIQQALGEQSPFQINYRIVTAFGDEKWVWEQGRGVFSRAGELLAIEGFIIDVTERRKIEESLRREKAFSDATIESLPGNFYVFDEHGKMLRWNNTVERVTGYCKAEIARMNPLDFFGLEDQKVIADAVADCFENGTITVEANLKTKSGTRLPYYFTGVRFEYQNLRMLVGLGLDVSERNRARDERARLQATLLQTQKLESLGVLAGAIAHDFNNLLTVVMGNAGLAQRTLAPGSAAHDFIEQALGASKDASHLTRKLRDYADLKSHVKTELDLSGQVAEFTGLLRTSVPRSVTLGFELGDDLPMVSADPAQMQQLLMNLVVNAAESYGDGAGAVRITTGRAHCDPAAPAGEIVRRGTPQPGPYVYLAVRDQGSGLDAPTLARIGEPFFTTKLAGRGLGLAAVLGILREHDGWLEVETRPGRGSTFRACLPLESRAPGAVV